MDAILKSFRTFEEFKNAEFEMERAQLLDRIHYLEQKVRDQQKRLELHEVLKNGGRLACDNKLEAQLK